ncbi:MAG: L-seryl-tRNA(Sec) selenium transferase, partial [Rubripirellula sp.]|nr:L-seryl-tRNA(Sec) selenium transferase [Rubripirellula sp.]
MSKTEKLRALPSVDEVLRSPGLAGLRGRLPHRRLSQWAKESIQFCRDEILAGKVGQNDSWLQQIVHLIERRQQADSGQAIQQVINGTGVVLHTNLGRAPLAEAAIKRMEQATGYANIELDLESGRRSKRGARVARMLAQLVGAEDAVIVNNCAAATMLVLQATAFGKEVIVSRGQLVEIGGGFRLPDVFVASGVKLREVGTTNRTYLRDYESAMGEQTGAVIRVHRSNFQQSGFVTEPTVDEMAALDRPSNVPVIDDLGSGCITDLASLGLDEPTVPASVACGTELTLFSGDKLFGGPQCGMIVGRKRWIDPIRTSPMMRAMRVDKLTLAALEATVEIHLAGRAMVELPVLRMLAADPQGLHERCEELKQRLPDQNCLDVVPCDSPVGGGAIPGATRPGFALRIRGRNANSIARMLREGTPA